MSFVRLGSYKPMTFRSVSYTHLKVLLFNDGAVTGRYAAARRIKGEPGVDSAKLDKVAMDAILSLIHI